MDSLDPPIVSLSKIFIDDSPGEILRNRNVSGIIIFNRGVFTLPQTKDKGMAKFDIESYDTVDTRLARFWEAHPEGRVLTKLEFHDERRFIVYSEIYFDRDDNTPVASGYAEEIVGASPVNRTSALENCETSSIGRALANCGFASQGKRPSAEEMQKVERYNAEPRKPVKEVAPAREFTADEIEKAGQGIKLAQGSPTVEGLKAIWDTFKDYADCPVDGVTLKTTVNARKKDLESV